MKHRGRVSKFAHVPSHYPQIDGGLAIYVIEFTNGIVKVGLTYDPRRRAQQLSLTASRVGVKVSRIYASGALRAKSAAETEKALIERVGRFANPCRRSTEFFSHTRFGAVDRVLAMCAACNLQLVPMTYRAVDPDEYRAMQVLAKRRLDDVAMQGQGA